MATLCILGGFLCSNLTLGGALWVKWRCKMPDDKSQGIVRTGRGEEQPADKERAQTATKTEPGHKPEQPVVKKSEGK